MDESRKLPVKPPSPCLVKCRGRAYNCHASCPKWKLYTILRDRYYIEMGKIREQEQIAYEQHVKAVKRKRRYSRKGRDPDGYTD